jgi:YgiT-type zinc finger domain-containing protein
MKCFLCPEGETLLASTTITIERDQCTVIIKDVPAEVCTICGEAYLSEETTEQVTKIVDDAVKPGAEVEIRRFRFAA